MKILLLLSLVLSSQLFSNEVSQFEQEAEDIMSGFEQEGEDIMSGFEKEGEDIMSGFEQEGEDIMAGFEDEAQVALSQNDDTSTDSELKNFTGKLSFKTAYGYKGHSVSGVDFSGLNQAQTALYIQYDKKLSKNWKLRVSGDAFYDSIFDINSRNYNDDTINTYQSQFRLDDTYLEGSLLSSLDLKAGRQIVVWGKSDSIRVTDVINPLDNRLPAMTDIEDLRLSVGMLKFDYYIDKWNFSAMIIPESRIMLEAAPKSEFFPSDDILPSSQGKAVPTLQTPDSSFNNMQYALSANGVFSGWDLSFYGANVLDQRWHINKQTQKREVSKIEMLGSAINIATGSFLLKSEVALLNSLRYNSTSEEKRRLDTLIGFDYMGIKDTVLSLEVVNRHIFNHEVVMSSINAPIPDYTDEDEMQSAFRASRSFLNDTLDANFLISLFGKNFEYGGFARTWIKYDIADALSTNVGLVDYIGGDRPFTNAIKNNDRVFADITYSF